ncbi:MAG: Transcription-repair-coupling factor [Elusimicrobia bacterium]|nr:Transcription-repair-coupling factor [Elusimicrobiota bacterium]
MPSGTSVNIAGMPRGALAWWLIQHQGAGKTLVVLPEEEEVLSLVDDARSLFKIPDGGLPQPFDIDGYPSDDEPMRQVSLHHWLYGKTALLIASRESLALPCDLPSAFRKRSFKLKPGLAMGRLKFEEVLSLAGYSRNERVEQVGEYAIRGDVIDIWLAGQESPVRLTWTFDTLDAIRTIDLHTLRSEEYLRETMLYPVTAGQGATLSDYLSEEITQIVVPGKGEENGLTPVDGDRDTEGYQPLPVFGGNIDRLREQLVKWHDDDWRVVIFCHNRGERERLEELLIDTLSAARGSRPPWLPPIVVGELEHGFIHPKFRQAVLPNSEIFGRFRKRTRLPKFEGGGGFASPLDIRPNDYLVHEKHGVGRYVGLQSLKVGKVTSEYLSIEYKGGDKLYVPIFEIQQVQKYLGAEGKRPALSSLDSASWERLKSKVKEDVAKLAAELLSKAAKRSIRPGYAFPPKSHLETEFAESFMYKLTPDQEKTLEDVEQDMTLPKAMDRLVCGDVGYGKTEIAMRAALKAALAGKQVCLLCPTTILAEQHARNFSERMADYPVTLQFISRFQEKSEQKKILEGVAKGGIDIIIGTHRLLSGDVTFANLGLLIIDEEHRFGVKQKNKLLALRETVDVLSLSATPIPRTLAFSMAGIKDLSVIETPPEGRLPISTHVGLFDEDVMAKAVQSELDRGGQVFYVHNRVKTLEARRDWLQKLMPSIRIAMAHGQMNEDQLEEAMHHFLHKKVDVLLATTIIESGLDIPSVNTLIVEEAEEMGLAQLYQLRGRVGRSKTKAYCYLFYGGGGLTTDAKKRLEALKEFTALGSGIRLAMRDMEIRGAGNLLGPQQHGNMAAVGIETYSKLLNEEIQKIRGGASDESPEGPLFEMSLSAYIPEDYMPAEMERVQTYKRILSADNVELGKIKEELIDRCGPLGAPVKLLFDTAALRLIAKEKGIAEVHQETEGILIYFRPTFTLGEKAFQTLIQSPRSEYALIPGPPTGVRVPFKEGESPLDTLGRFLRGVFSSSSLAK